MEAECSIPASGDNTSEAVMSEAWREFLQSWYRASWIIRVSRYKVDKWPVNSLGSRKLVNAHWRSVAVQFIPKPEICLGIGF